MKMPATDDRESNEPNMYDVLKISSTATSTEVRRAYRNLITKQHPDKGGDAQKFALIQRAYDVLSDEDKRTRYDNTGTYEKTVEEELLEEFGGGAFRDRGAEDIAQRETLAEAIVTREEQKGSHTAGFEAWMRARGDANKTFGVDDIIDKYGVVKGSYEETPLPKIRAFNVLYSKVGHPKDSFDLKSEPIPQALEWGQVLISVRAAPINPADMFPTAGAEAGNRARAPPFVAGSDCLATVLKVGAGVNVLAEGDWVMPFKSNLGTWRSLATCKEKDLMKIPADLMPVEYAAMTRELCTAYRLLEVRREPTGWLKFTKYHEPYDEGGASAARLADTLQDGCHLVCFGCMSGRPITVPWTSFVSKGLVVKGFSLRQWMSANKKKVPKMMETIAKLVNADKLRVEYTEYELSAETRYGEPCARFQEALEHSLEPGRGTKILLTVNDIGQTYE